MLYLSVVLAVAGKFLGASAAAHRPHVLFVLADDYGWANFGVHRRGDPAGDQDIKQAQAEVHTPNLDSLVDAGILLDRHYAYKICSPSRSSLQSGRLAVHVNPLNTGDTVHNPSDPVSGFSGIPRNMTGMAQKMRTGGYRTHMVGKWDAGCATPEHTPLGRGYESWIGYFTHANDYWRKGVGSIGSADDIDNCLNSFTDFFITNATYRGGVRDATSLSDKCKTSEEPDPECYEEHVFKQHALAVINGHDTSNVDAPLFLFYAFHLLHTPLQVPLSYLKRIDGLVAAAGGKPITSANRRLYAAMTLYMDDTVGELVSALKSKGMFDNTLIVFTADNGGPIYEPGAANNHPLKGGKYSDWEGGIRTNAFVAGGFVPPSRRGSTFEGVISIADWYGTLSELAGVDMTDQAALEANKWLKQKGLPLLPPVDSVAQWPYILNNTNGRPAPLHVSENAVLQWPYKLVTGRVVYSDWQGVLYPNCSTVHNVENDNGPVFVDAKVFGVPMPLARDPKVLDRVEWSKDCGSRGCLHNIRDDPSETTDLAQDPSHAKILATLQDALKSLNQDLFAPNRGHEVLAACEKAIDNGGFYGPFVDAEDWYTSVPAPSAAQKLKNAALKRSLAVLNHEFVEEGIELVAKKLFPLVRKRMNTRVDKCVAPADNGLPSPLTLVV